MTADVAKLSAELASNDAAVRVAAAEQLAQLGSDAAIAAAALARAAGDADESVSEYALAALEELGPPEPSTMNSLADLVTDENSDCAYWAATLLGRLGSGGAAVVDQLAAALATSPHTNVRQRVAWALGNIGSGASAALDQLQDAARSDDSRLARLSTEAINAIKS